MLIALLSGLSLVSGQFEDEPPQEFTNTVVIAAPLKGLVEAGILWPHAIIDIRTQDGQEMRLFLPMLSPDEAIPPPRAVCDFTVHMTSLYARDPFGGEGQDWTPVWGAQGFVIDRFDCRLIGGPEIEDARRPQRPVSYPD